MCCVGALPDAAQALGLRLTAAGNRLLLVGERRDELGGSEVARLLGQPEHGRVPTADFAVERACGRALLALAEKGEVVACHDIFQSQGFKAALNSITDPPHLYLCPEKGQPPSGCYLGQHPSLLCTGMGPYP